MALAAEQGQHVAVLLRERLRRVHVVADTREALEIFLDIGARFLPLDAELVCQSESRDAVDDSEVDRLRPPAHFGWHALDRYCEHLRGSHGVNIEILAKCLPQRLDLRDLGQESQLDLRIVRRYQLVSRPGDEGAPDLTAL